MRYEHVVDPDARKRGLKPGHYIFDQRNGYVGPFQTKEAAEQWAKNTKLKRQRAARCDHGL